jgi:hypothetical protein
MRAAGRPWATEQVCAEPCAGLREHGGHLRFFPAPGSSAIVIPARSASQAARDLREDGPVCQRSPKESHSGSPIWSQCGDVTGSLPWWLALFLLWSVTATGATGGELLLGVLGPEALAGNLNKVRAVGQPIEGGGGQQRLAEELSPLRSITIAREEN